jgi:hypothetical protein
MQHITEDLGHNYIIQPIIKEYKVLTLNKGSFSGCEVLFNNNYKYSLRVNDDHTILYEFDVEDYNGEDTLFNELKQTLTENVSIVERKTKLLSNVIESNKTFPQYRNVLQKGLKKELPNNFWVKVNEGKRTTMKRGVHVNKIEINKEMNIIQNKQPISRDARARSVFCKRVFNNKTGNASAIEGSDECSKEGGNSFFMTGMTIKGKYKRSRHLMFINNSACNILNGSNSNNNNNVNRSYIMKESKSTGNLLRNTSLASLEKSLHRSFINFNNSKTSYITRNFNIPLISTLLS